MNGYAASTHYAEQLEAFRKSDAERDALVAQVLKDFEELKHAYQEKCDDFSNEVESRRLWQSKASSNERALIELRQASGSNSFVVVILDGDGAIFQDYLWAQGKDGGADAAHLLNNEIKNHLKASYPDAMVDDWTILVQVILNFQGLATKLHRCNIISNPNEALAFGRSFGLAQPCFSFIDVGAGKERADHKIRETLRLFLPQSQCKHVFFGPSHDNGYVVVLERYKREYASRLTLIETRPAEPGFVDLGLKRIKLPQVFRSDDLPNRTFSEPVASSAPPIRAQSISQMQPNSTTFVPSAAPKSPSPAPSAESGASSSWATIGKSGSGKNIDIAPKKAPARKFMLFNVQEERLDEQLPKPDGVAQKRFADRLKQQERNCCNEYHLTGCCSKGDEFCDYLHGPRLSGGELLVLKHKARSLVCPQSSYCMDVDCYRGHHCKVGKKCPLDHRCYFADSHNIDMRPARKMYEDGSEEWLQSFFGGT